MATNKVIPISRFPSGVRNFDALLCGGLPQESITLLAGPPGTGKTTLAQQIAFHNATPERPAVFFQTLSEPTVKTLKYLKQFSFFDPTKIDKSIHFVDLGLLLRTEGLGSAVEMLMAHVKRLQPGIVVIDSFKVFSELAPSREDLRKFTYQLLVNLVVWECTTFLLGEFTQTDLESNPLLSIVDGLLMLTALESSGEQQRFLQIIKMRGTDHDRDRHPLVISDHGIDIYAPGAELKPSELGATKRTSTFRKTGIPTFDALLGKGILSGFSVLVSGAAGTGKTLLSLEMLYRGAKEFNEKGIYISFEESEERQVAAAAELGMDLQSEIERGMITIICIPQPDILVERHLQFIQERIAQMGAQRVVIDSLSVFLHKITDLAIVREKIFQLAAIIQRAQAIGFFVVDRPYSTGQLSHFGIEETIVDGIILLSAIEHADDRKRYMEVYKLRNTDHAKRRYPFTIGATGLQVSSLGGQ